MKHKHKTHGILISHDHIETGFHKMLCYRNNAVWRCANTDTFDFTQALRMHIAMVRGFFHYTALATCFPQLIDFNFAKIINDVCNANGTLAAAYARSNDNNDPPRVRGLHREILRGVRSLEVFDMEHNIIVVRSRTKMPRKTKKAGLHGHLKSMYGHTSFNDYHNGLVARYLTTVIHEITGIPVLSSVCGDRIKLMPDFFQLQAALERYVSDNNPEKVPEPWSSKSSRTAIKQDAFAWLRKVWNYPETDSEPDAITLDVVEMLDLDYQAEVSDAVTALVDEVESECVTQDNDDSEKASS
jgi:hypothetical protein